MWHVEDVKYHRGGPVTVEAESAPLGMPLPYARAAGEHPDGPTELSEALHSGGWQVLFVPTWAPAEQQSPAVRLGDLLLGLSVANAIVHADRVCGGEQRELLYVGDRTRLIARSDLALETVESRSGHRIVAAGGSPLRVDVRPSRPPVWQANVDAPESKPTASLPTWLDRRDTVTDVHASLPMRYRLQVEQDLGVRLPDVESAAPLFRSHVEKPDPGHVVFIATTSSPSKKDYGLSRYCELAQALGERSLNNLRFTFVLPTDVGFAPILPGDALRGVPASECIDLFASANLVIGNDTGLTHLAALTRRKDDSGPDVIGLYGQHSYLKWRTGTWRHHAVATRYSQMLALADVDSYVNQYGQYINSAIWGGAPDLARVASEGVADFALSCIQDEPPEPTAVS
jgi:hypothetical protein